MAHQRARRLSVARQTNNESGGMKRAILALGIGLLSTQAHAHHRHHHRHHHLHAARHTHAVGSTWAAHSSHVAAPFSSARPRDCYGIPWCGCFMRHLMGVADATYNLARNWARYGSNAGGPRPGAIVVFPHHVGLLVRPGSGGRWVVLSGNDGHAVRERERSIAGAIAFRSPS